MNPEFSRASVATLIAAIIGSVLDSEDDVPESRRSPQQPPAEVPPAVLARLSSLLRHYDFRVSGIEETTKYQVAFGPSSDPQ